MNERFPESVSRTEMKDALSHRECGALWTEPSRADLAKSSSISKERQRAHPACYQFINMLLFIEL